MIALAAALGAACLSSLLGAARLLGGPAIAVVIVAGAWLLVAGLVAFLLVPGLDWVPGRTLRRARSLDGAPSVALTIDDGPHPETTPALLEALARSDVRATFFLVGEQVRRWPELARRIAAEGHAIGNHTQRHRLLAFRTRAEVERGIDECQGTLAAVGIAPSLFRPPHGFKPIGLHGVLGRRGLRLVAWQGTLRDTDAPGVAVLVERALRIAAPGRILLVHDNPTTRGQTAEALPEIVGRYRALGLRFVTLA